MIFSSQKMSQSLMAVLFCHPGKAPIIARDPYSRHYLNGRSLTSKRLEATAFTFKQWEDAIAHCRANGMDDIDFLLTFPGVAEPVCFRIRVSSPHPYVDYASLA